MGQINLDSSKIMIKKDILFVTLNWSNIGGSQKRAQILNRNFSKFLITNYLSLNNYLENKSNKNNVVSKLSRILSYRKILNQYKIVVTFSPLPSLISLFSNTYNITVITGSSLHYKDSNILSRLYWGIFLEPLIYIFSKKIVPAAPHLIPFYIRKTYLNKKVNLINGLIDINEIDNKSYDNKISNNIPSQKDLERYICISSAITKHKAVIDFLKIYAEYRAIMHDKSLNLIIIGEGPLLNDCFELCKNLNLQFQFDDQGNKNKNINNIIFTGHLESPYSVIKNCSLFVMPSFYEGLSNQLLEAIYSGIPIIASDCPGNKFVYDEIAKDDFKYINSKYLQLIPAINNKDNQVKWLKYLVNHTKNFNKGKYKTKKNIIFKFSLEHNFPKWKELISDMVHDKYLK